jgi:hypothetical protein
MPLPLQVISQVFVPTHVTRILTTSEFSSLRFSCDPSELLPDGSCLFTTGQQVRHSTSLSVLVHSSDLFVCVGGSIVDRCWMCSTSRV